MPHEGYFNKIIQYPCSIAPDFTWNNQHMQKQSHAREWEIKTKEGKKHTKQCNHKYEICLIKII